MVSMLAGILMLSGAALPVWEFNDPGDLSAWVPNAQLSEVVVRDGAVQAHAVDWDPFFQCRGIAIDATPWQYVVIRMKADRSGEGELFWSGETEGRNGGLSQEKSTRFTVLGDQAWHEIPIFPFWQKEGTIRQLRLDVFDNLRFEIDFIRVAEWGGGTAPLTDTYRWDFGDSLAGSWRIHPESSDMFAPPIDLNTEGRGWVTVTLRAAQDAEGAVLWANREAWGLQSESFAIRGDGQWRTYNVELGSYGTWKSRIAAFGLRLPEAARPEIQSVSINEEPSGPPDWVVNYFGFENGVNRAGRSCRVMVQIENRGGSAGSLTGLGIDLPQGVTLLKGPSPAALASVDYNDADTMTWEVQAQAPGTYPVKLLSDGATLSGPDTAALRFFAARDIESMEYVPEPHPVKTDFDLCMYYFPGWNTDAKWDCVRRVAPIRKPLLGYYDESRVECVDWQIKWAVENGIRCFLVDWYWVGGSQHLTHWFDAYRQARYRDMLQVAIMWANHNPPNTHTREDWRKVTQEWIARYFNLPGYYTLRGKPAIFLWNPDGLRSDLGGASEAKAALEESQAMARAAGYAGIEFVAVNSNQSPALVKQLAEETYSGVTNYHEWAQAVDLAPTPNRPRFDDLADTLPAKWEERDRECAPTIYYPLIETGWDSRPWHGNKSLVIGGRSVAAFERILRAARAFSEARDHRMMVIGPANEWGEGSYIEPNTEFDFDMYEAIRRVFAQGDPATWPENLSPEDVGRGPYDFPPRPTITSWEFDKDAGGWSAMMNISGLHVLDGNLTFLTDSGDPALTLSLDDLRASKYGRLIVRMRIKAAASQASAAQLFWSAGGASCSESASVSIPVAMDGEVHEYAFDLKTHPRWRNRISSFRFDPCDAPGAEVCIDRIALVENQ